LRFVQAVSVYSFSSFRIPLPTTKAAAGGLSAVQFRLPLSARAEDALQPATPPSSANHGTGNLGFARATPANF